MTHTWMPTTYTAPLQDPMVSDGPKLRRFVELFCKTEDGKPLVLDPFQAWVIDAVLERYPDDWHDPALAGRLRYRSAVISMGRQNGKSEIATVLGFYGLLMHEPAPYMVGLASNADQAYLIYKRVKYTIDNDPHLRKRFKATGWRGIRRLDKQGFYTTKAAKADALQGIPVTLCLFDEVHICKPDMWSAMTLGTQAKRDGLVIGLTTAGDDSSELLKDLYDQGKAAVAGSGSQRFGFFVWEAPEGARVDDPDAIRAANPAVACGRRDLSVVLELVRTMPEADARRFVLNQFVSSQSTWLPMATWQQAASGPETAPVGPVTFTVDRTPSWEYASVTATVKTEDGYWTHVVWSGRKVTPEWLLDVCQRLNAHSPTAFVMDGRMLGDLASELTRRGLPVRVLRGSDIYNACATAYALITSGKVSHPDDALLRQQMPHAVRKNGGDGWRIVRPSTSNAIDCVMGMVMGLYVSSTMQPDELSLAFV